MMPRLVVKIIGGKQVRWFVEEPEADVATREAALVEASIQDFEKPSEKPDVKEPSGEGCAVWADVQQVPDRRCVTAPSGDRSRSYIHLRPRPGPATVLQRGGQSPEDEDQAQLSLAVADELSDWPISSLSLTEEAAAALDASSGGTLHHSHLAAVFLKNQVPLTLPTFALLLQIFSDGTDPDQVHYQNLLHFIRSSAGAREDPQGPGDDSLK